MERAAMVGRARRSRRSPSSGSFPRTAADVAGTAVPARGDLGRARARTSRCSPSTPSASSSASSTPDGAEIRHDLPQRTAFNWHGYLPGVGPGAALRLPRPRPVRTRARASLQPGEAPDRPVREGDRGRRRTGTRRACSPYAPGRRRRAPDDEDDAAAIPKSIVIDPAFDWEGDELLRTPWHETVIYEAARQGLHEAPPGRARGSARHLRGPRVRRGDRLPAGSSA